MGFYIRLAWRNIWRNRKRSLISVASILFAMLIALVTRSMQLGFYRHAIDNAVSFYTGYAQIQAPEFSQSQSIDDSFADSDSITAALHADGRITVAAPRLESFALASRGESTDGVLVVGIDPVRENSLTGLAKRVIKGRFLTSDDRGILVGETLADHLHVDTGDTLVLLGQGYHAVTAAGKFRISGVIKFPLPELDAGVVFMTLPTAQSLFGADGRLTSTALMVGRESDLPAVITSLHEHLGNAYRVLSWREIMPELDQYVRSDNASGIIMLAILYLVIGFGILGTVLMMTLERTREFGMLISIGMSRGVLRRIVVLESAWLSLVGALAGVVAGVPLILYLHRHPILLAGDWAEVMRRYGFDPIMPFAMDIGMFIWQSVTVLVIALIVAIYPALRVTKLDPVSAMRTG